MSTPHADTKLQHLKESLTTVDRRQPGWFEAEKAQIEPTIMARNSAQSAYHTVQTNRRLKVARKKVKLAFTAAENSWIKALMQRIDKMGDGASTADCWETIALLRKGKSMTKKLDKMTLRKPDGSKCTTDEENAKVMGDYLSTFDPAAIAKARQRDPKMYAPR
jgi:hypothetical protein